LRLVAISMTDAAWFLEMASYALVAAFGLHLLWRKIGTSRNERGHVHHDGRQAQRNGHGHHTHDHHHHAHDGGEVCDTCGHAHAPAPQDVGTARLSAREAWGIILAVGLRPCSGAIVVLSFALLNGLYLAGIVSVFAMALGTAITVSTLAALAVHAKALALRMSGGQSVAIGSGIEIAAAGAVFLLGAGMFYAGLTA
jgi:ABC-type nickel/cobalt efflux system permease component RcnA